ncbi:MAG: hypothetical protein J6A04_05725 [Clostridia bacterium]|nr:hypothetical protein [Clostridia bacterium]
MIIKNSNIRRSLFENRYVIFAIVFAIILVLYLIQVLNAESKKESIVQDNKVQNETAQVVDKSSQTVISGKDVTTTQQESNTKIIEEFITYCNNKEIEKAYSLLTEECKEEVFAGNIQYFKQNYVDKIFTSKKMCGMQSWINSYMYTYKVTIQDDMLSTGKTNSSGNKIEDYYTIVKQENSYKLNINSYIGRQQINKESQLNGIKITIICKNIYKDYESYDIKIENLSQKTILLDSKEKVNSIYLVGSNENKYDAYSYEIDKTQLILEPLRTKTLTINFNKIYSNKARMQQMVFTDIITDYEEYENMQNKNEYTNRIKISIEI